MSTGPGEVAGGARPGLKHFRRTSKLTGGVWAAKQGNEPVGTALGHG